MPADESRERPPVRLPYIRIEGAGGAVVWMLGLFIAGGPAFLATRMVEPLRPFGKVLIIALLLVLLLMFLDYWKFEERVEIDGVSVKHRRTTLLGRQEWTERLANYKGLALVTTPKGAPAAGSPHWSRRKPERVIQLVHPQAERSVTLYEFDARDFREAVGHKITQLSKLLNVEILTRIER